MKYDDFVRQVEEEGLFPHWIDDDIHHLRMELASFEEDTATEVFDRNEVVILYNVPGLATDTSGFPVIDYELYNQTEDDIRDWFKANCTGRGFQITRYIYLFDKSQDAMLFRLTWG